MRITLYGEHAFRILAYLAERNGERCTVGEISAAYRVSENHLRHEVFHLGKSGFVRTYRGRGGGLELGRAPASIKLGAVFRAVERDLGAGDFDPLVPIAREALDAYLAVLDRYTLEDVLREGRPFCINPDCWATVGGRSRLHRARIYADWDWVYLYVRVNVIDIAVSYEFQILSFADLVKWAFPPWVKAKDGGRPLAPS